MLKFSKKNTLIVFVIIIIIAIIAKFVLSSPTSIINYDFKMVATVPVTRDNLSSSVTLNAELIPFQEVDLHAKIAGYLKSIYVKEGDAVTKGQVIASLDIGELKSDLQSRKASYVEAKLNYHRINQVVKKHPGILAQEEVDKARSLYEIAKANYEKAEILRGYATITAPFTGIISKRYVDPGALVQAGVNSSTQAMPIVHVVDNTKLIIVFPIPESLVSQVKVGTGVEVAIDSTNQIIKSKIARVAGKINRATRTMETEVDIDNSKRLITPGMYASVKMNLEEKKLVLTLPVQAVSITGKPNVWIVNNQNQIEERPVIIGLQTADKIEIISGVSEGDQVIFGSRGLLKVGMLVKSKSISNSNKKTPVKNE